MDIKNITQTYSQFSHKVQDGFEKIQGLLDEIQQEAQKGNQQAQQWSQKLQEISDSLQNGQNKIGNIFQQVSGFLDNKTAHDKNASGDKTESSPVTDILGKFLKK